MYLTACILAHDAARWLPRAVDSLIRGRNDALYRAGVERIAIAVDDRSTDGTREWAELLATATGGYVVARPYTFTEARGFAGAYNDAVDLAGGEWTFVLDADEEFDHAAARRLRGLCEEADRDGVDLLGFARKNWWDRERTRLRAEWFPDVQHRLMRKHVRFEGRVHSGHTGERGRRVVPWEDGTLIHHFNLAYRTQADWDVTNAFYDRLIKLDQEHGRPT